MDTTQQESKVRLALMVKDAVIHHGTVSTTALITASDFVNITNGHDLTTGMRFTLEQWREIVDFVEGMIAPIEPVEEREAWEPDWATIPHAYNSAAVDGDGRLHAYTESAYRNSEQWLGGDVYPLGDVELPDGVSWKDTLCTRPGVSLR